MSPHALALAALLLVPLAPQAPPPSAEEIAAYRGELEGALAPDADPKARRRAIQRARDHVDPSVIAVLDARALRHPDLGVRDFTAETMGHMRHPDVLPALAATLARDAEALAAAPARKTGLLRAIARQARAESVPLLEADAFASPDRQLLAARLLGLANVRDPAALEAVVRLLRAAPPERRAEAGVEFRAAVLVLTGRDPGPDPAAWPAWLERHERELAVAPEMPEELPADVRRRWLMFWGPTRDDSKRPAERPKPERKRAK